jgi:hypothetical protein
MSTTLSLRLVQIKHKPRNASQLIITCVGPLVRLVMRSVPIMACQQKPPPKHTGGSSEMNLSIIGKDSYKRLQEVPSFISALTIPIHLPTANRCRYAIGLQLTGTCIITNFVRTTHFRSPPVGSSTSTERVKDEEANNAARTTEESPPQSHMSRLHAAFLAQTYAISLSRKAALAGINKTTISVAVVVDSQTIVNETAVSPARIINATTTDDNKAMSAVIVAANTTPSAVPEYLAF